MNQITFRKRLFVCMTAIILSVSAFSLIGLIASAEPVVFSSSMPDIDNPRAHVAAVMGDDGKIYLIGGVENNIGGAEDPHNKLMIYDPETGQTTNGSEMDYGVLAASVVKGTDGLIYVFGGFNWSELPTYMSHVQIYNPENNTWTYGANNSPVSITFASAASSDGKIYIFGPYQNKNSTLIYDTTSETWSYGQDIPTPRDGSSAVFINDSAICVMGGREPSSAITTAVEIYNPKTNNWISASSLNVARVCGGAVMGADGLIYFMGGVASGFYSSAPQLNNMDIYDSSTDTWELYDSFIPAGTQFGIVLDEYGRIIVLGGYNGAVIVKDVYAIVATEISIINEIEIADPTDGSEVNGVVSIQVVAKNVEPWIDFNAVDLFIDGQLHERQVYDSVYWVFMWDTNGITPDTQHTILVRGFASDSSVSEDSITVTVTAKSIDERLDDLEGDTDDIADSINDLNNSLSGNISDLNSSLSESINQIDNTIDGLEDDINNVQDSANSANNYALFGMIIAIIVAILVAVNIVVSMKKR